MYRPEGETVSISLQTPLADFFSATNARDTDALFALFAPDATVDDEGFEYRGLDAIRGWIAETIERFSFNIDVVDASHAAEQASIVGIVSGDFQGSPAHVHYDFKLDQQKIVSLRVGA
jgi:ketosteroid isomerase-like protein